MYNLILLIIVCIILLCLIKGKENMTNRVLYSKYNITHNDKIKDSNLRIMIHKINKIISEDIKNISIRENNYIITKIEDIVYKEIVRKKKNRNRLHNFGYG